MHPLPPLLTLLYLSLPLTCASSPAPPLLTTPYAISLMPLHTLFLRQASDLQTFTAGLGNVRAPPITSSGDAERPFSVNGNSFTDFKAAGERSCDEQFQGCQGVANANGGGGGGAGGGGAGDAKAKGKGKKGRDEGKLTVAMCDAQKDQCNQAQSTARVRDFKTPAASTNIGPDPLFPDFDLICEG